MITPAEYWDLCTAHDWTFVMSDDGTKYRKGKAQQRRLLAEGDKHPELSSMYDAFYASAWWKNPANDTPPVGPGYDADYWQRFRAAEASRPQRPCLP